MAEPFVMPETDIKALTDALCAQQQLLQKLYTDLDQEREASSTAADEALSMILRLQGEKSAMKMEASHYKRLAEEKICHAEEALAIFEDLIYQKEMEIASLEFQLQAYRYKLLSMGISTELGAGDNVYPENLLFQRTDNGGNGGETSVSGTVRRINSLPPLDLKEYLNKINTVDKERDKAAMTKPEYVIDRSVIPKPEPVVDRPMIPKPEPVVDRPMIPKPEPVAKKPEKKPEKKVDHEFNPHSIDIEKKSGNYGSANMNTIWEQIKKLDARVKEISDVKDYGREKSTLFKGPARTCSLPPIPKLNLGALRDPTTEEFVATLDQLQHNENVHEREAVPSPSISSSVHDVFEVPKSCVNLKAGEGEKKVVSKLTAEVENRRGKPDLVSDETTSEARGSDETDRIKKVLHLKKQDSKMFKARDVLSPTGSNLRERMAGVTESQQAKFQQLWRRIERLEGERNSIRHEISHAGEEEVKLFQEIHDHLNVIQYEMRSLRPKKSPPKDDEPLHTVMEAMLHFWI